MSPSQMVRNFLKEIFKIEKTRRGDLILMKEEIYASQCKPHQIFRVKNFEKIQRKPIWRTVMTRVQIPAGAFNLRFIIRIIFSYLHIDSLIAE